MTLRIVFMGTPEFAVPSLAELIASGYDIIRVYTQPPRPAGRGKSMQKSPVHQFAEIMGLDVRTPEKFRSAGVIDDLETLEADVACVVAYGQILPQRALDAPKYGSLNLHGSLLPRWRGAAPIQRAIMAGDTETGVQIMQMSKGLDTGDILLSETVPIADDDTTETLAGRLSRVGAGMWPRVLGAIERDALVPKPQQGEPVYAHKIDKAEARINWGKTAKELDCHIRGLAPFPGAWCMINDQRVKIHIAKPLPSTHDLNIEPGTALDDTLQIACREGALQLITVQPAGKAKMSAEDFLRGNSVPAGTVLS